MQWLNKIVDETIARTPDGEIIIESGGSPSGTHHMGHLRELVTCDAILLELQRRGRQAKHIYYVDDLDGLRKVAPNVPPEYSKYLGQSLCDIPAPDGSDQSYADFFIQDLFDAADGLSMDINFIRTHPKYRAGFFIPAIEKALENIDKIRDILETISGHKLGEEWSPIQINENGYLKKRKFMSLDKNAKTITYEDVDGNQQTTGYAKGEVKLDWRVDWPARWWLLHVAVEPAGRDHSTKGGSFDTGQAILKDVFGKPEILAVPYDFVNMAGDNKKMSASAGTGLDALGVVKVLPPEIVKFFMLRFPPGKRLYFDPQNGVSLLIDEFAELLNKKDKTADDEQLIYVCTNNIKPTVSRVPFSHLVASYQAALKDADKTLELLKRTGYQKIVSSEEQVIRAQLKFVERWLKEWAAEDVKFELLDKVNSGDFSGAEKDFLKTLAGKVEQAPADADGEYFHKAIYELATEREMQPKEAFGILYRALIGKTSGPRAGWFLSILPRDWLVKRLKLES